MPLPKHFDILHDDHDVQSVTIGNQSVSAEILTYGAVVRSLYVPDRNDTPTDIVLGYDSINEYATRSGRLGATIGRFANRISDSRFILNDKEYILNANKGRNHIHGDNVGFDRRIWNIS